MVDVGTTDAGIIRDGMAALGVNTQAPGFSVDNIITMFDRGAMTPGQKMTYDMGLHRNREYGGPDAKLPVDEGRAAVGTGNSSFAALYEGILPGTNKLDRAVGNASAAFGTAPTPPVQIKLPSLAPKPIVPAAPVVPQMNIPNFNAMLNIPSLPTFDPMAGAGGSAGSDLYSSGVH
jgi:hypothetical protein